MRLSLHPPRANDSSASELQKTVLVNELAKVEAQFEIANVL
jgi:hypothetical protein